MGKFDFCSTARHTREREAAVIKRVIDQRDAWRDTALEHTRTIAGLSYHLDAARKLAAHQGAEVVMLRAHLASMFQRPKPLGARPIIHKGEQS